MGIPFFSELMDFNTGSLEKFETFAAPVELVIVDLGNAMALGSACCTSGRVTSVPSTSISQQLSYPVGMPFQPKEMMEWFFTMTQPTRRRFA